MTREAGDAGSRPVTSLMVLCYHAVSETWPSPAAISPRRLRAQLRFLLRRGYRPMTLSAALATDAPTQALVVTFDDAYASILSAGLPVLEELGVPATVFAPTDAAATAAVMTWSQLAQWTGGEHEHELRCMSWDELRHLVARGWEIGSHTCSHPDLTTLGTEALADELRRSRAACEEQLRLACPTLAYPFGSHDARVMEAVAATGYRAAVTLDERLATPLGPRGPLEIPREAIYRDTGWTAFLAKTSRMVRGLRVSRSYRSLRRI